MIGPRGQSAASLTSQEIEAPFPILADPTRVAYRAYGFAKSLWIIQQSGTVIVDREGIVRYVHQSTNPQNGFQEEDVLEAVAEIGGKTAGR